MRNRITFVSLYLASDEDFLLVLVDIQVFSPASLVML